MKEGFRWTNNEKRFVLEKIKNENRDLMPNEIKQLLNEYKQKVQKKIRDFGEELRTYERTYKSIIHLPRQYFPKTLKPLNLSYVLDSEGTFY